MPEITLSIPEDVYKRMNEHKGIRWTEVVKRAIVDYISRLEEGKLEVTTEVLLEELGREFANELTEISIEDAMGFYDKMREKEWRRFYTIQAV